MKTLISTFILSTLIAGPVVAGALNTAIEQCTKTIARPSTIESELEAIRQQVEEMEANGWNRMDPENPAHVELFFSVYEISSELLKVAADPDTYGSQYNGAAPHEYWRVIRNYAPNSFWSNLEPQGPNGRAQWLASPDGLAILNLAGPPAQRCTFYQLKEHFDASILTDVPTLEIEGYEMGPYQYHVDTDARYDGGVSEALLVEGAPFDEVLQVDVPDAWRIAISRGWE